MCGPVRLHILMFYVYVLRSEIDRELYIGSTNDLKRRCAEHNAGKVPATQPRRPYTLRYYEAYMVESDARRRESQLKARGNARRWLIERIKESLSS